MRPLSSLLGLTLGLTTLASPLVSSLASPPHAAAQASAATPRVQVLDFTVDGDPPPAQYRQMLVDGIAPTISTIEACYNQRLPTNPTLAGDYRLRLWVSARQVIRTTPETSLNDATLEECTRAAIRTFTLPPQAPEGGATVRFIVRFTAPPPGTVPAPTPPPPVVTQTPVAPTPPPVVSEPRVTVAIRSRTGALTAEQITAAFPGSVFETCATGITGTLPLTVNVSTRGRVTATGSRGTTGSAAAASCAVRQARTVTAPTARRASTARLTLTFVR